MTGPIIGPSGDINFPSQQELQEMMDAGRRIGLPGLGLTGKLKQKEGLQDSPGLNPQDTVVTSEPSTSKVPPPKPVRPPDETQEGFVELAELEALELSDQAAGEASRLRGRSFRKTGTGRDQLQELEKELKQTAGEDPESIKILPQSETSLAVDPTRFELAARYNFDKFPNYAEPVSLKHVENIFKIWDPKAREAIEAPHKVLSKPAEGVVMFGGLADEIKITSKAAKVEGRPFTGFSLFDGDIAQGKGISGPVAILWEEDKTRGSSAEIFSLFAQAA